MFKNLKNLIYIKSQGLTTGYMILEEDNNSNKTSDERKLINPYTVMIIMVAKYEFK